MKGGKTLHELMLKDTPFSDVLQKKQIRNMQDAHDYCAALDFVIQEWSEAMDKFGIDGIEEVKSAVLGSLIGVRMVFINLESDEPLDYIESMKAFQDLKRTMSPISKSYSETPVLSCWYSQLPIIALDAFVHLRRERRQKKW